MFQIKEIASDSRAQIQRMQALKTEMTTLWFAATKERCEKKRSDLLNKYRSLRRCFEIEQCLSVQA